MALCRLCLQSDSNSLISVLNNEEIINKINECVSIQITDDDLPTIVCTTCLQKVEDWYTFRDTCLKSNESLLEWNEKNEKLKNGSNQIKLENDDGMECVLENDDMDSVFIKEEYEQEEEDEMKFELETYGCEICPKKFNNLLEYLDHQHVHDGQPVFKCDRCAKVLSSRDGLVEHERNHNEKLFKCKLCNYVAGTTAAVSEHMRHIHSKDIHVCTVCSKILKSIRNLNSHLKRVHIGEKKHQCTQCDERFIDKCNLLVHLRSHTDVKPYVPTRCNKGHASSSGLSKLKANHENRIWLQCLQCKGNFASEKEVRIHQCPVPVNL